MRFSKVYKSLDNDNVEAVLNISVDNSESIYITSILASFTTNVSNAELKIMVGGTEEFTFNFSDRFQYNPTVPITFDAGQDITVRLTASGAAGSLSDLMVAAYSKYGNF